MYRLLIFRKSLLFIKEFEQKLQMTISVGESVQFFDKMPDKKDFLKMINL